MRLLSSWLRGCYPTGPGVETGRQLGVFLGRPRAGEPAERSRRNENQCQHRNPGEHCHLSDSDLPNAFLAQGAASQNEAGVIAMHALTTAAMRLAPLGFQVNRYSPCS